MIAENKLHQERLVLRVQVTVVYRNKCCDVISLPPPSSPLPLCAAH